MTGLEVDNTIEGLLHRVRSSVTIYIYIYAINMTLTYEILSEILLYIYCIGKILLLYSNKYQYEDMGI